MNKWEEIKGSVLIIEGKPSLSKELTSALEEAGFVAVDAASFPEALVKLSRFKPDLVIMDAILPGSDGMDGYYRLRELLGIPIVLLGEDSSDEAWRKVMEADADLYLVKPVGRLELVARVKSILRRWHSEMGNN